MIGVESAEIIALQVFEFIASSDKQLDRFMVESGCDPASMRAAVKSRDGLAGLLDYLCADESLLLTFCETAKVPPSAPVQALAALQQQASTGAL